MEEHYVAGAVDKRVHEFAAGRACARAGLAQLGFGSVAIPAGADRAPRWPAGATGSITHTNGLCAAVVASSGRIRALGLDVERNRCVRPELWRRICTPEEVAVLGTLGEAAALEMATLIFSAKEAFYKCQHTLTGQWLNFPDITVTVGPDGFVVRPNRTLDISAHLAGPWSGRYRLETETDHLITGLCIV